MIFIVIESCRFSWWYSSKGLCTLAYSHAHSFRKYPMLHFNHAESQAKYTRTCRRLLVTNVCTQKLVTGLIKPHIYKWDCIIKLKMLTIKNCSRTIQLPSIYSFLEQACIISVHAYQRQMCACASVCGSLKYM